MKVNPPVTFSIFALAPTRASSAGSRRTIVPADCAAADPDTHSTAPHDRKQPRCCMAALLPTKMASPPVSAFRGDYHNLVWTGDSRLLTLSVTRDTVHLCCLFV